MKTTLKKLALLPLFCGLLLTSACGNDDNGNQYSEPPDLSERLLPSRIFDIYQSEYGSEIASDEFTYDNLNRITRVRMFDYLYFEGEKTEIWEGIIDIAYNADGTIATIRLTGEDGERLCTFTYSGNTVTRISIEEENGSVWRDTSQFEINNRGQLVREWGNSWEMVYTYNANGNFIRRVETETWNGETDEWATNFEYSTTVRAVFRYTATPEWALHFILDLTGFLPKHGFMPTRIWGDESNWQDVITYSVDNGWVQTMTFREEEIGSQPAVASMMRTSENFRANGNRLLRQNDNRLRNDNPRRTPATKSNGNNDYWEWTLHFEYDNAR